MRFTKTFQKTFTNIGMIPYKYDNGKIYKIISPNTNDIYIGSTITTLKNRLRDHKYQYKQYLKGKINFITSFSIIEKGEPEIILIENYPCKSKKELHRHEGIIQKTNVCVNMSIAGRTKDEYNNDNKEKLSSIRKQKRINNIDKCREYDRMMYHKHKTSIQERVKKKRKLGLMKDYDIAYREKNKEKLRIKSLNYTRKHKVRISESRKKTYTCECGKVLRWCSKARHERSNKHKKFINQ